MILIKKYNENNEIGKINNNIENLIEKNNKKENNEDIMKALKNKKFWLIVGISFFASFNQHFIVATSRTYGALIGIDGKILQYLGIVNSLSLIIISPLFGHLTDKIGTKIILSFIIILNGLISFGFGFFIDYNLMYIILNFSIHIVFSGFLTSMNPHIMHIFGLKNSIILIGINGIFSTFSNIISSLTAFIISKYYHGTTITIPYKFCFFIGGFLNIISFILIMYDNDVPFDYNDDLQKNNLENGNETELEEK
jgi:MFS family permease